MPKGCDMIGSVMDKVIPRTQRLDDFEDELTSCGICPSLELEKRQAFHTLSPRGLSGEPLARSKAKRPFGLGSKREEA